MNNLTKSLIIISSLLFIFGCTVQKKKGEVGAVKKFYHNTTARYNGYFNADVLLTESMANLTDGYQDNYNKLLSLYPWMDNDNVDSEKGSLDEAAKKVSVVVNLHRVSDWTDDCYLILGQTQFIKKSYEDAENTFEFMQAEFSPKELAKKKKKAAKSAKKGSKKKKRRTSGSKKKKKRPDTKSTVSKKDKKRVTGKKKKKKRGKVGSKKRPPTTSKKDNSVKPKPEIKEAPKPKPPVADASVKKKEKDDDEPTAMEIEAENKFMNHRPVWQDGRLWLVKTYIQREMFSEAGYILESLENDPKTFKEIKKELYKTRALFHIRQKQYEQAIAPLQKTISLSKDRMEKARINYILGQIQQRLGNSSEAMVYFQNAQRMSIDYSLAFSAKLQQEQNGLLNGQKTAEQTLKSMERMLKDDKNVEYKDQIYFAMGQIALNQPDAIAAKGYFQQSLGAGSSNKYQQAESYLALAYLYNDAEDFVSAKNYFDSTLTVLPVSDERVETVKAYQENLEEIAANIEIINLQDSLLRISGMSKDDRKSVAQKIKDEQYARALEKKRTEIAKAGQPKRTTPTGRRGVTIAPSTFFAYNDKGIKKGRRDFEKKFGDRALEDNWRRSQRTDASQNDLLAEVNTEKKTELTEDDINEILKDVPGNPEQVKIAEAKIIKAMFTLGSLYRDRLDRNDLSTEILEELAQRFAENKHEVESWYMMYLGYKDLKNTTRANHWKNRLMENYPNSIFAQSIGDPDFLAKANKKRNEIASYYEDTYAMFVDHKYQAVSQRLMEAKTKFTQPHDLRAKFALLNAMTLGNIQGREAYVSALKDIIAQYPNSEEQIRSREILRLLGEGKVAGVQNKTNKGKAKDGVFSKNSGEVHYFIVALKDLDLKLSDAKTLITDYHQEFHKLDRLRISNIYLGADTSVPILVIRRFKNEDEAMKYFDGVQRNKDGYLGGVSGFETFALSQSNYRQVLKTKSLDAYRDFFQENYLE